MLLGPIRTKAGHMAHSHTAGPFCAFPTFKYLSLSFSLPHSCPSPIFLFCKGWLHLRSIFPTTMQPCVDDVSDDIDNLSINSTTTSATATSATTTTTATTSTTTITTAIETKCSTSSGSETTTWTASSHASSSSSSSAKPHAPSQDPCWTAIRRMKSENPAATSTLGLEDLRFLHRLGSGDIGSVYLVELKGSNGCMFAAKVMDKKELVTRNKDDRARIEREILEILDHPFLPSLYATLDSPRWSCLLTEFCPGGDLHVIRQNQPEKRFDEAAVRFYASEVVVALEYLHMMGIIYRDLKPENVLVRSDGHIMLTDFDLSLKGDSSTSKAQLVSDQNPQVQNPINEYQNDPHLFDTSSCIIPNCIAPAVSCFHPKRKRKKRSDHRGTLEIVAEPIDVRSMSFVGTHEYLAPEIVSGEGHGSAVDWWTLGIFIYEMFYGVTPFKGVGHDLTLTNIVARALQFPKEPTVAGSAKDLMVQRLMKDPTTRMGSTMGASSIKRHPFFDGVNWALLRCAKPPYIPRLVTHRDFVLTDKGTGNSVEYY